MPTTKAAQHTGPFTTDGSRPADLKDLNAGLYGSQPPPTARARGARPGEPLRKVLGGDGAAVGAGSRAVHLLAAAAFQQGHVASTEHVDHVYAMNVTGK
ncbi:unnamed protein product [Urochloa humidicola]